MAFNFLPCLLPYEVLKLQNDQPWYFRCGGVGHISRYCSTAQNCAWCAAEHNTKTFPVKNESSRPAASPPPTLNHLRIKWSAHATFSRGLACGTAAFQCSSVPALFSDSVALWFCCSPPSVPTISAPKYCPTFISCTTHMLPVFNVTSPDQLYSNLVSATHDFHRLHVSRPHLQRLLAAHSLDF